uniref:DDE_3 domain-containing protein n=1 Tax=Rhabditophanes sp. KR3021 TaxID=114890 RepID=A0AC35TX37_9BILA
MGRGKMLTQYEIGQILAFNADGINISEISGRLNRSRCKFNLDGPDGYAYYWHDLRKEKLVKPKRQMGGGSLMLWGCFSKNFKPALAAVPVNMDGIKYHQLLKDHVLPLLAEPERRRSIFMQDNAPCHRAFSTIKWLDDQKVQVMKWPPYSPDLNPIENLWGILTRSVYAGNRTFSSVEELKKEVIKCWKNIPKATIKKLVESMPDRIFDVIANNGRSTKY